MFLYLLIGFSLLFVISHLGLASRSIKAALVKVLGEKTTRLVYALVAFVTLGGAIFMYAAFDSHGGVLWIPLGWSNPLVYILMALFFVFIVFSQANPSPVGMPTGAKPEARGILRVTSHPQNMAMICFGLAHVLVTGTPGGIALYGSFALLGLLGSWHESATTRKNPNVAIQTFMKETAVLPFWAIIRGRNKFVASEFKLSGLLAAALAFGVATGLHFIL